MIAFFLSGFWGIMSWSPFLLSPLTTVNFHKQIQAPEKLFLKHCRHSFVGLIGPRWRTCTSHKSGCWIFFLFLLLPEEDSHSDLLSPVFVAERLLPIPWKTAQAASVSHILGSGSQKDQDASPKVLSLLPFSIHSPGISCWIFLEAGAPIFWRAKDQQNSPVRKEKVLAHPPWKMLKKAHRGSKLLN